MSSKSTVRRVGISLSAAAILVGAVACDSDDKKDDKKSDKSASQGAAKSSDDRSPVQALQAAYKKTSAVKSAKVHMTTSATGTTPSESGEMVMDGVMAWNPTAADLTMTGGPSMGGGSGKTRMIMLDSAMYMQMPAESMKDAPAELRSKKWMKIDLKDAPTAELQKQMTAKMDNANQDPAKQMAALLDSPSLKRVGEETVNGVKAQHYKGTLTLDEMLKGKESAKVMDAKEREKLLENAKKAGIKGYDTEFWVNGEDLPVKMIMGMDTAQGKVKINIDYTDYGTKADVKAPPADETADFAQMMKDLAKSIEDAKKQS
ncbi:lipoprotein [Streptomyces thioluteus]|uniref:Lipoprotein n=1 Tax=Streptomyces thioluteus TaxID=66431 RepID=A0ABP6J0U4_STRTU